MHRALNQIGERMDPLTPEQTLHIRRVRADLTKFHTLPRLGNSRFGTQKTKTNTRDAKQPHTQHTTTQTTRKTRGGGWVLPDVPARIGRSFGKRERNPAQHDNKQNNNKGLAQCAGQSWPELWQRGAEPSPTRRDSKLQNKGLD